MPEGQELREALQNNEPQEPLAIGVMPAVEREIVAKALEDTAKYIESATDGSERIKDGERGNLWKKALTDLIDRKLDSLNDDNQRLDYLSALNNNTELDLGITAAALTTASTVTDRRDLIVDAIHTRVISKDEVLKGRYSHSESWKKGENIFKLSNKTEMTGPARRTFKTFGRIYSELIARGLFTDNNFINIFPQNDLSAFTLDRADLWARASSNGVSETEFNNWYIQFRTNLKTLYSAVNNFQFNRAVTNNPISAAINTQIAGDPNLRTEYQNNTIGSVDKYILQDLIQGSFYLFAKHGEGTEVEPINEEYNTVLPQVIESEDRHIISLPYSEDSTALRTSRINYAEALENGGGQETLREHGSKIITQYEHAAYKDERERYTEDVRAYVKGELIADHPDLNLVDTTGVDRQANRERIMEEAFDLFMKENEELLRARMQKASEKRSLLDKLGEVMNKKASLKVAISTGILVGANLIPGLSTIARIVAVSMASAGASAALGSRQGQKLLTYINTNDFVNSSQRTNEEIQKRLAVLYQDSQRTDLSYIPQRNYVLGDNAQLIYKYQTSLKERFIQRMRESEVVDQIKNLKTNGQVLDFILEEMAQIQKDFLTNLEEEKANLEKRWWGRRAKEYIVGASAVLGTTFMLQTVFGIANHRAENIESSSERSFLPWNEDNNTIESDVGESSGEAVIDPFDPDFGGSVDNSGEASNGNRVGINPFADDFDQNIPPNNEGDTLNRTPFGDPRSNNPNLNINN